MASEAHVAEGAHGPDALAHDLAMSRRFLFASFAQLGNDVLLGWTSPVCSIDVRLPNTSTARSMSIPFTAWLGMRLNGQHVDLFTCGEVGCLGDMSPGLEVRAQQLHLGAGAGQGRFSEQEAQRRLC